VHPAQRPFWLALALVALILLQQVTIVPMHGRLASGVSNGVHGLWFAVVTAVVYALVRTRVAAGRALGVTAVVGIVLSLATEAVQIGTARAAQWQDVVFDLCGGASVLLVLAARMGRLPRGRAYWGAAALLAITLLPAVVAATVQLHRNAIFPVLVDISAWRFGGLLTSDSALRVVPRAGGGAALEILLADDTWPGIHLDEPVPDWRGYDRLAVDVFVPEASAPLELHVSIRLRGGETDHVYRTFVLPSGETTVRLPLRELFDPDANEVSAVVIYSRRPFAGRRLELRRVALERDATRREPAA
jgi:hypothetical protein